MKRRAVVAKLRHHGCQPDPTSSGPHEKWTCPCGGHFAAVPRHREVAAGTCRVIQQTMSCLEKGWLQ